MGGTCALRLLLWPWTTDRKPMKTSANDWATRRRIEAERAEWTRIHGLACELCGNVPKTRGLEWDHDHKTERHRGWLCHRCNRALPSWITAEWLRKAADYLER